MAFYGSLGEVNYGALDASITDTAVDIFVYDTSKDSDGGAWRHRTQHTSWYNETLNTATRGSRREFPAVAVIVAEAIQVTIYDGDDPDLPMWMIFNSTSPSYLIESGVRSITAKNGKLASGCVYDLYVIDFISEKQLEYLNTLTNTSSYNIANRNSTPYKSSLYQSYGIVNRSVNDVAMTVLPNAPIDSTTGLPIPTIAVATDGGVSVIKDDGTVVDLKRSSGSFTNTVQFTDNNSIMLVWGHASDAIRHINHYSYADWQSDQNDYDQSTGYNELPQFGSGALQSPLKTTASGIVPGVLVNLNGQNRMSAKWDDYGLKIADLNDSNRANGMVTFITTSYSSGIMSGDIKRAFLSDTDATNVTSNEIVPNSEFLSGDGWTLGTGYSISGGLLSDTSSSEISSTLSDSFALATGTHTLSYQVTGSGGLPTIFVKKSSNNTSVASLQISSDPFDGVMTKTFDVTSAENYYVELNGTNFTGTYDYISIIAGTGTRTYASESDRSVNNRPLDVHGTITKTPVATGADLVAYSGFNNSNYLEQPYNSSLDFGTGDFSFMCWSKNTGPYEGFFGYGNNSSSAGSLYVQTGNTFASFRIAVDGTKRQTSSSGLISLSTWNFMTVVRKSGIIYCYHNATQFATITDLTASIGNTNNTLRIGVLGNLSVSHGIGDDALDTGSISLFRLSASAPSPEQIKKIYEDEKVLFQENAACTLYGSSDAVTALAYDDFNDLLHVGTSSGRSDFQGLRRINNTTTAVSTAISASNDLIAEQ